VLQYFQELGFRQFILSAMEQKSLEESIENRGITPFFDGISGINNNLAHSKLENARELISNYKINPKESILIGDTIHDAEVAGDIGIDVVLVARGHQSEERLQKTGLPVINNLSKLKNLLTIG
jgi:phosphoglycolate phosphatase